MAEFTVNPEGVRELNDAIEMALLGTTQYLQAKIVDVTPRDLNRLPQNINRKDGEDPHRSTHFKPVNIGGNWYAWVSGKLQQSIAYQEVNDSEFKIWVSQGPTSEYAKYLEFGTRRMRPRSFLRKGIIDNEKGAMDIFKKLFKSEIW